jgi:hypothetical protein
VRHKTTNQPHGYNRYTSGCRCEVCTKAKRDYTAERREQAAQRRAAVEALGVRYVAEGIKRGYSGYANYQCRCEVCRAAKADADSRTGGHR